VADPTTTSSDGTIVANIGETEDYAPRDFEQGSGETPGIDGCAEAAEQP
jgi:hypothetical protein